jgi:hypothetical protein
MDAQRFYTSPEWLAVRERVLARDGNACTVRRLLGGRCSGVLHVHHIEARVDRPDLALDEDNLGTACARHHPRWEALARALRRERGSEVPPCRHVHRYRSGREACERRRRELVSA